MQHQVLHSSPVEDARSPEYLRGLKDGRNGRLASSVDEGYRSGYSLGRRLRAADRADEWN
jgi:hypothetical protein